MGREGPGKEDDKKKIFVRAGPKVSEGTPPVVFCGNAACREGVCTDCYGTIRSTADVATCNDGRFNTGVGSRHSIGPVIGSLGTLGTAVPP